MSLPFMYSSIVVCYLIINFILNLQQFEGTIITSNYEKNKGEKAVHASRKSPICIL